MFRKLRPGRLASARRYRRHVKWRSRTVKAIAKAENEAVEHQGICDAAVMEDDNYALARAHLRLADKLFDEVSDLRAQLVTRTWRWVSSKA